MKKIVFVNKFLITGGIEKCVELLAKELQGKYEFEFVHFSKKLYDERMKERIEKYAKVTMMEEYDNKPLKCDVCIMCHLYIDYLKVKENIVADKYYAWVHSMPRIAPNCLLDDQKFVDFVEEFICVSEAVKNNLKISKSGIVIKNFVDTDIKTMAQDSNPFESLKGIKLVTASRLSSEKGFKRAKKLADSLDKANVEYTWLVAGKGFEEEKEIKDMFVNNKNVIFVGNKLNPYPYIKNADYLVQLSDDESWCISISEALSLHVPVIVTDFESSKEQVTNLKNGIIIPREEQDYDKYVDVILDSNQKLKDNIQDFVYHNEVEKWIEIFE